MADSDHSSTPSKSPAFQFYPKDFLTDENVRLMSMQERGIYITLMAYCWIEGTLPVEPKLLARLCGMPVTQFRRLWSAIAPCFDVNPLNAERLIHPRLDKERVKQIMYSRRQSDRGKLGGRPQSQTEAEHTAPTKALALPESALPPPSTATKAAESSSSSSSSADSSQHSRKERESVSRTRMGSGVMGGTLPRDHLRHSWCGRVCVPDFLHGQFVQATGQTDESLKSFYSQTFAAIPEDEPVEPDSLKFWRPLVVQRWPPKKQSGDGITAETLAAGLREARERGDFNARH